MSQDADASPVRYDETTVPGFVAATIGARSTKRFFTELWNLTIPYDKVPLEELPELLRFFRVIGYLKLDMDFDGMWRFLGEWPEEFGAYTNEALEWCRRIGAERTAAYLAATSALFPGGRVPADFTQRTLGVSAIQARSKTAFRTIDREFRDWPRDLAPALRRYLAAHRDEVEALALRAARAQARARSLEGLLAIDDPEQFVETLSDELYSTNRTSDRFEQRPELTQMAISLRALHLYAGHEGMWKFLNNGGAAEDLARIEGWCRRIGARRAVAYIRDTARAFPGKRVPSDDAERHRLLADFSDRDPDPLAVIDAKHEGALDDMLVRFHRYLRKHPEVLAAGLAAHAAEMEAAAVN